MKRTIIPSRRTIRITNRVTEAKRGRAQVEQAVPLNGSGKVEERGMLFFSHSSPVSFGLAGNHIVSTISLLVHFSLFHKVPPLWPDLLNLIVLGSKQPFLHQAVPFCSIFFFSHRSITHMSNISYLSLCRVSRIAFLHITFPLQVCETSTQCYRSFPPFSIPLTSPPPPLTSKKPGPHELDTHTSSLRPEFGYEGV